VLRLNTCTVILLWYVLPVLHIRIWSDPDLFGRIRILIKWPYINFFGVCKSHKNLQDLCCLTFLVISILFRAYFRRKIFLKKLGWKYIWVKIWTFPKSGPVKNCPDPQHCMQRKRNWTQRMCNVHKQEIHLVNVWISN
jgi:hypothetical protein